MTARRRTPSPAPPRTTYPSSSGPRWMSFSTMRSTAARVTPRSPPSVTMPAIPHILRSAPHRPRDPLSRDHCHHVSRIRIEVPTPRRAGGDPARRAAEYLQSRDRIENVGQVREADFPAASGHVQHLESCLCQRGLDRLFGEVEQVCPRCDETPMPSEQAGGQAANIPGRQGEDAIPAQNMVRSLEMTNRGPHVFDEVPHRHDLEVLVPEIDLGELSTFDAATSALTRDFTRVP